MVTIFGLRGAETRAWSRPKALRWVRAANSTPTLTARLLHAQCDRTTIRLMGGDCFGCELDFAGPVAAERWLERHAPDLGPVALVRG